MCSSISVEIRNKSRICSEKNKFTQRSQVSLWTSRVGNVTVDVQVAATISPVNCSADRLFESQNGSYLLVSLFYRLSGCLKSNYTYDAHYLDSHDDS